MIIKQLANIWYIYDGISGISGISAISSTVPSIYTSIISQLLP